MCPHADGYMSYTPSFAPNQRRRQPISYTCERESSSYPSRTYIHDTRHLHSFPLLQTPNHRPRTPRIPTQSKTENLQGGHSSSSALARKYCKRCTISEVLSLESGFGFIRRSVKVSPCTKPRSVGVIGVCFVRRAGRGLCVCPCRYGIRILHRTQSS
jgi:hypothetical protein